MARGMRWEGSNLEADMAVRKRTHLTLAGIIDGGEPWRALDSPGDARQARGPSVQMRCPLFFSPPVCPQVSLSRLQALFWGALPHPSPPPLPSESWPSPPPRLCKHFARSPGNASPLLPHLSLPPCTQSLPCPPLPSLSQFTPALQSARSRKKSPQPAPPRGWQRRAG